MEEMLDIYSDLIDFNDTYQFGIDSYNYCSVMKEKDRIIRLIEEKLEEVEYHKNDGLSIDLSVID